MKPGLLEDGASEVTVEREDTLYDGFRQMTGFTVSYREPGDESWHGPIRREYMTGCGAAIVLPYDPDADRLVLIRQFRLSGHLLDGRGFLIEPVAGNVDENESPREAALRELIEETGLAATALLEFGSALSSPGIVDEHLTFFFALVDSSRLEARTGHDAEEVIFPFTCRPEEAIEAADAGRIRNAPGVLALNWFARKGRETARRLLASEKEGGN